MTENEAIKIATHCLGVQAEQEVCEECDIYGNCHTDCKYVAVVAIKALEEIQQYREIGTVKECKEMASIVKKSERSELAKIIDEWLKYRKIGTVEECKEMAVIANKKTNPDELAKIIVEWIQYNKIGTVEECRGAMEKQKAKKPKLKYKPRFLGKTMYTCPNCGNCCLEEFANERQNNNYCWDCGQRLDFGGNGR